MYVYLLAELLDKQSNRFKTIDDELQLCKKTQILLLCTQVAFFISQQKPKGYDITTSELNELRDFIELSNLGGLFCFLINKTGNTLGLQGLRWAMGGF